MVMGQGPRQLATLSSTGSPRYFGAMAHARDDQPAARRGLLGLLRTSEPRPLALGHLFLLTVSLLFGCVSGVLVRLLSRGDPNASIGLMRTHGAVMVLLVVVPAIPLTLGNLLLPSLQGDRPVAFPRLRRAAMQLHVAAIVVLVIAVATGGSHAGFRLANAYSADQADGSLLWLGASAFAMAAGLCCSAIATMAIVARSALAGPRADGTPQGRGQALAWGLGAASLLHVVTAALLGATLVLVACERAIGLGVLEPRLGGTPQLYVALTWAVVHPAVASALVAAAAVATHLIETYSGRPGGARRVGPWLLALALASLVGWGQHLQSMPEVGQAALEASACGLMFYVPLGVIVLTWLRLLRGGAIALRTPMLYALAVLAHLAVSAAAGVLLALPGLGAYLGGAAFASGQLHYTAFGCTLFALLGGLHHVWESVFGRRYREAHARLAFGGLVVGTNLAFMPMLLLGVRGVPHLVLLDVTGGSALTLACTCGAVLASVSLLAAIAVLLAPLLTAARPPLVAASSASASPLDGPAAEQG